MDTSYGIGIANRYALFMGEEDQDPGSQQQQQPILGKGKENKVTAVPKKVSGPNVAVPRGGGSGGSKPAPATGTRSQNVSGQGNRSNVPSQGTGKLAGNRDRQSNDSRGPRSENAAKTGGPRQDRPQREPRPDNGTGV